MNAPADQIAATKKRFEIYVPKPKVRINMGERSDKDQPNGPFGYPGLSMQSDESLFIDCNKSSLFQATLDYCAQVGGKWMQYSNADMWISSTANVNLSADAKITIAAGSGQGQITQIDHGNVLRMIGYNNLSLHYTIDALQVGLFEFFHGRHTRIGGKRFASDTNRTMIPPILTASKAKNADGEGFLKSALTSLEQLNPPAAPGEKAHELHKALLETAVVNAKDDVDETREYLAYGFSKYYKSFDPYLKKKGGRVVKILNLIVSMRRYADVALKYGGAIQSLPIIRNAIRLAEAADQLVYSLYKSYHMATDSYPALAAFEKSDKGGVVDELNSGVLARVAQPVSLAADEDKRKAKVTSAEQPDKGWDLSGQETWTFKVQWDGGEETVRLSPRAAQPAVLTLRAPTLSSSPESKVLVLRVGAAEHSVTLAPGTTSSADSLATALSAVIPSAAASVTVVSGKARVRGLPRIALGTDPGADTLPWTRPSAPTTAQLWVNGELVSVTLTAEQLATLTAFEGAVAAALGDRASVEADAANDRVEITPVAPVVTLVDRGDTKSLLRRLELSTSALSNPTSELDLKAPQLSSTGEKEQLVFSVDGSRFTVPLDATTSLGAALRQIARLDLLVTITEASDGSVELRTKSAGGSSRLRVLHVDLESRWTFSPSRDEHGVEAVPHMLTVAQLVGYVKKKLGEDAKATQEGKTLVVEAAKKGEGSTITVSGDLADLVFGSNAKSETLGAPEKKAKTAAEKDLDWVKTLRAWNHELQKLPEDTRNLTRPLTNAINDTVAAIGALEKVYKKLKDVVGALPGPPKSIGMFSQDGITLGTPDRIVANGGRGIVLIADGGSGIQDRGKYVLTENWVEALTELGESFDEWLAKKLGLDEPKPTKCSLGFRVLSDSAVELSATTFAQLAALGRGKAAEARIDGETDDVGIGIARVVGSYAAEVVGYEKVVISARAEGTDAKAGKAGRVELAAQTIAIGAASRVDWKSADNKATLRLGDFDGTPRFGIDPIPFGADKWAGAEHLEDPVFARLSAEHKAVAWTSKLRDDKAGKHPHTEQVAIHGDRVVARSLPFKVEMSKDALILGFDLELYNEQTQVLQGRIQALTQDIAAIDARLNIIRPLIAQLTPLAVMDNASRARLDDYNAELIQLNGQRAAKDIERQNKQVIVADRQAYGPVPRLEMKMDSIRMGFTTTEGKWIIHNPPPAYNGNWFVAEANANKAYPFLNMQKDVLGFHQNPSLVLSQGKATLSNGKGMLEVSKDKALMDFKQGLSAGDGSIKIDVKGGSILLG